MRRYGRVEFVLTVALGMALGGFLVTVAGCSERRTFNHYVTGPTIDRPETPPAPGDSCEWHPGHGRGHSHGKKPRKPKRHN